MVVTERLISETIEKQVAIGWELSAISTASEKGKYLLLFKRSSSS